MLGSGRRPNGSKHRAVVTTQPHPINSNQAAGRGVDKLPQDSSKTAGHANAGWCHSGCLAEPSVAEISLGAPCASDLGVRSSSSSSSHCAAQCGAGDRQRLARHGNSAQGIEARPSLRSLHGSTAWPQQQAQGLRHRATGRRRSVLLPRVQPRAQPCAVPTCHLLS